MKKSRACQCRQASTCTAKVAAKGAGAGAADRLKEVSSQTTKNATENDLKRPPASVPPLPNERTRSKRIKSASSSRVVSDNPSVHAYVYVYHKKL